MKYNDSGAYLKSLQQVDRSSLPEDGGERFNRLIFSSSPYLLQHAENPVRWYEWGEQAFTAARDGSLPVLVSVGYATCHWCHVMAGESFEDREVADLLNRHFICIKVDREERPDIDDFCMAVSQVMTGSGGWPLNVFMTPEKRPFFAMTYLPKRGRDGMTGLLDLLAGIAALWHQQPDRIEANCSGIIEALARVSAPKRHDTPPDANLTFLSAEALQQLSGSFDQHFGGFGNAPKFPMPINLTWLIRNKQPEARAMALQTLHIMRAGGIWDHLGGGLHRYATDRQWRVPHFEKMLYDQAMVAHAALDAYCLTGDQCYREMVENILTFVGRDLSNWQGGFYSALDADSENREGACYLWRREEIETLLGDEADLFCRLYDISETGNFEGGENILHMPLPLDRFSAQEGLDAAELAHRIGQCRSILLTARRARIQPLRDEKIITAWNGLMIAAYARSSAVLDIPEHRDQATSAADFILTRLRRADGRLLRSFLNGPSKAPAFLEDYSALMFGLIELYNATLDTSRRDQALLLADETVRLFWDQEAGVMRKTGFDAEAMPHPASLDHDGVMPSPLSQTAWCLERLSRLIGRQDLRESASRAVERPLADAQRHAASQLLALTVANALNEEPPVFNFSGPVGTQGFRALMTTAAKSGLFSAVYRHSGNTNAVPSVSVCAYGTCHRSMTDPEELVQLLSTLA